MSIQFGSQPNPAPSGGVSEGQEIIPYDMQKDRENLSQALVGSQEVDNIVSTISVFDLSTIVEFGGEVAGEISKCSDQVLSGMNMRQIDDSVDALQRTVFSRRCHKISPRAQIASHIRGRRVLACQCRHSS